MDPCADNSTECLLRAILAANTGFDWNVVNFAGTAAIGILALVIAIMTVFQGFMLSGPGRLKASNKAIGPFSRKTASRFDWREFRIRTTASNPFLSRTSLSGALSKALRGNTHKDSKKDIRTDYEKSQGPDYRKYPATWLNILDYLHVSHIEYETLVFETDYAPADLQAATARITVETLVFLAACAGCDEIELVDGYPQMTGSALQIRIIQHQQLGLLASYEAFPQQSTYHHSSLLRNYMYHLHGMGVLSYKGSPVIGLMPDVLKADGVHEILLDLKAKSRMCEHSECKTAFVPLGPSPGELII